MPESDSKYTAQNMIAVHGLRAQAVVQERIVESRMQGELIRPRALAECRSRHWRAAPHRAKSLRARLIGWGGRDRTSV
jgi:hypothetical protein